MTTDPDPLALAERFIDGYNVKDFDSVAELLAPYVGVRPHNREVALTGHDAMVKR